jgi:hypothetical protein
MEMQVGDNTQECTPREGKCWCSKYWTVEIHKADKLASEMLRRWLSTMPMKQVYFIVARRPDSSISYKHATLSASKKAMDPVMCCAARTCQEQINGSCLLLGKGLSLGALRRLVWIVYQFCTVYKKKCVDNIWNFYDTANELEHGNTKEIETNFDTFDNCAAYSHLDYLKNIELGFLSRTPHPWYSQWTWE